MRKDQGFGCSNLSITLGPRFMLCSAGQRKIVAAFWCVSSTQGRANTVWSRQEMHREEAGHIKKTMAEQESGATANGSGQ